MTEAREQANLTQRELSKKVGAAHNFVNKYENGDRELSFWQFEALAKAMGDDPVELARAIWNSDEAPDFDR